ncbi:MAG: T9SS type A sorting domain-containing protein [Bacteroidota bacterium]
MTTFFKKWWALCATLLMFLTGYSQPDSLAGVINTYAHVSNLDAINSTITVDNITDFVVDGKVMLMQMRGAAINTNNSSNFGDINNIGGAGSYMFGRICVVDTPSSQIILQETIDPTFATSAFDSAGIQLITVPEYLGNVVIRGTLTADPWDGQKGGVLVFDALGTVKLDANVDVSGLGFKGGEKMPTGSTCSWFSPTTTAYYDYFGGSLDGAMKGGGITEYVSGRTGGYGKLANGGGGGNNHNTGGGGGSNYGAGGSGGNRIRFGIFECFGEEPGDPGITLSFDGYSFANNRIFLGGGGGAGHGNNNESEKGGNGGGIVMIFADQIDGQARVISADGEDVIDSGSDGGSGGGGGGVIALEVNNIINNLDLSVKGGDGANTGVADCQGPGGGGGGGVIWSSLPLSVGVSSNISAGTAGIATVGTCGGGSQGATNGGNGAVLTGFAPPSALGITCILPAFWESLDGIINNNGIELQGIAKSLDQPYQLEVRKQIDGVWALKSRSAINPNHQGKRTFQWMDFQPDLGSNIYQMALIDAAGQEILSPITEVFWESSLPLTWSILTDPSTQESLKVRVVSDREREVEWELLDARGRLIWAQKDKLSPGSQIREWALSGQAKGIYMLSLKSAGQKSYRKIIR